MAKVAKNGTPSLCSQLPPHGHRITLDAFDAGAGEAISAGDLCFIDDDGLVYRSQATADTPTKEGSFMGMAPTGAGIGEPCTIIWGERFDYADTGDLTAGKFYYVHSDKGALSDAKIYDGQKPVGFAVTDTVLQLLTPFDGLSLEYDAGIGALFALDGHTHT